MMLEAYLTVMLEWLSLLKLLQSLFEYRIHSINSPWQRILIDVVSGML